MSRAVEGAPGAVPPVGPWVLGRQGAWGNPCFSFHGSTSAVCSRARRWEGISEAVLFSLEHRPETPHDQPQAQVCGANPSSPGVQASCGYCVLLATLLAPAGWHHQPLPGYLCSLLSVKTGASWGRAGPRVLWKEGGARAGAWEGFPAWAGSGAPPCGRSCERWGLGRSERPRKFLAGSLPCGPARRSLVSP